MSRLTPFINRAIDELRQKSLNDVQVETALTWAGRACVVQGIERDISFVPKPLSQAKREG